MSISGHSNTLNAKEEAAQLFQWLIKPVKSDQFFKELWEKKPVLIKRHNCNYNDGWFSTKDLAHILDKNPVQFGSQLVLTSHRDGRMKTHSNRGGRAFPDLVWKTYHEEGATVQLIDPQTYSEPIWRLLDTLQDFFRSSMRCNVYLSPPGTQKDPPHCENSEVFLLQLEGRKHWRLYAPKLENEALPHIYSESQGQQHDLGKVILDTTLQAGDVLYFPRGTLHQGTSLPDSHSLHAMICTYQNNAWVDFLETLLPRALSIAKQTDNEYRAGLPLDFLDYTGTSKSDVDSPNRRPFIKKVNYLLKKLVDHAPVDDTADEMASRLLHSALPPYPHRPSVLGRSVISPRSETVCEGARANCDSTRASCEGARASCEGVRTVNTPVMPGPELVGSGSSSSIPDRVTVNTRVRLITPYAARLLVRGDSVSLQHSCSNTRIYHEVQPQNIDYVAEFGPALEMLTNTYPHFLEVRALPLEEPTNVELVQELLDMRILQQKLPSVTKSHVSPIIAAIKARVNKPPAKIKSRSRKGSEGEILVNRRNGFKKSVSSRPSSEVFERYKPDEIYYENRNTH